MHVAIVSHLLKFYINVINLVNVCHLICCILINFSVSLRVKLQNSKNQNINKDKIGSFYLSNKGTN